MKITFDTILGDVFINNFMHAGDVFESGKQLGTFQVMSMDLEGNPDITAVLNYMWNGFKVSGINGVFLCINSIDGIKDTKYPIFFKEKVQTISDGNKWGLFKDYLQQMGYDCETDEHMHVISVNYKKQN